MKVLHTSDWHLGQSFYEHDRSEEHQLFLDWLCDALVEQQIDVLLISGDVFHTATPPASAEKQLYTFIQKASQQCPQLHIILIAGNHDSANRIETAKPLLTLFNTHVIGRFNKQAPEQVVIDLPIAAQHMHVVAMPFLRSADLPKPLDDEFDYQAGVQLAYQHALSTIEEVKGPIVLMGHLHAKGGTISEDSERNLNIGGFDAVSAGVFGEQFDYVALGHLHKAQTVAKQSAIRYCGTPLPMSFSERNYKHQVLLAEFNEQGLVDVNPLYVPRFKDVLYIPEDGAKRLTELCEAIAAQDFSKFDSAPYIRLKLSAAETNSRFRAEIDEALKGKDIKFCGIERVSKGAAASEWLFEDLGKVESLSPNTLLDIAYREIEPEQEKAPATLHEKLAEVIASMEE
ncbi:exonuclease sbcCD subunit D [Pseudoalteromonas piscicida]|uniref:Nuclease SbcCD subunit D n=1 Tax=Pseudoalteromonas piscicida TaxID=43662 RepID=A0AAQ2EVC7_PSEO7|nr:MULTISPECIES: exonuclease subunit SbcD [Pseudoalteromonas]KJY86295.1 metallophosphatase [Pseudoalteromonas piscicida]TMN34653.1 exonuclease sbcCD subunit D [Pseudoalteromonas piscicida]TMN35117.1 exonuclease sbcCD subunit D [Pseudoalteromonas piscicida]TMN46616.1 exonuclease sbcCD subunit D [Pseudoalteromonas piscicida]TMN58294.1 exonuclease sbcCD subunit D [Pseudoalteromonas piscicida]